ncbi:MAG TPA: phosphoadenylyl-sulfate reductase [Kofleriaceae bacterium]|jgi:phosphoadenosine phosphosulfate reductase
MTTPPEEARWATWVDWAVDNYGAGLRVACSLSVEDSLLVDAVAARSAARGLTKDDSPTVFVLDTGRLHEESYRLLASLRERYKLAFAVMFPEPTRLEPILRTKGPVSFYDSIEDRRECCHVRKVEPLARALVGASAWMTGQRRAQSATRTNLSPLEHDADRGGIAKLNPLAYLSDADLWAEATQRNVPINALHRAGYPSIGCAPCTRAVQPGADPRSGRWWWEDPEHKECGLHTHAPTQDAR